MSVIERKVDIGPRDGKNEAGKIAGNDDDHQIKIASSTVQCSRSRETIPRLTDYCKSPISHWPPN